MPLLQFADEKQLVSFVVSAKLPEWQRKLFKKYADAIQVHSRGEIFYKIDRLFPNEHPESKGHRILAFESITEASFGRAANNVNRIFKNSSYTVEASEKVIAYTTADNFEGANFYTWFLEEWVKQSLKTDPNSLIVVYPPSYTEKTGRKPVVFVDSCHIKYLSEDQVVFVSEEESVVDYELKEGCIESEVFYDQSINKRNVREAQKNTYTPKIEATIKRYVYHVFFKGVGFYRIEQTVDNTKEYEIEFYPIEQDFLPCTDVGGEKGTKDVNKSFLHPFVSFGNLALLQHSQHTAVNFTFSFPRMSEIQTPCDAEGCNSGRIGCETEEDKAKYGDFKTCIKCGGSGYTRNQTPYKVYVKNYDPQGMEGDQKYLDVDDVKYYTPDASILDYSKKEWKDYLIMAETAVYISQRVETGNVESADSKRVGQEDMYSFLVRVGQCFFNKMRFTVQCLENYYVKNPTQVSIPTPYSYAILTEAEAFESLEKILASNVPTMLKATRVKDFISKFVSQNSPIKKFVDVLEAVDMLLYYSLGEIKGLKADQIVTPDQYSIHIFAFPTLQNMYAADKTMFFNNEINVIVDKLKKELEKYRPKPVQSMQERIIGQQQPQS